MKNLFELKDKTITKIDNWSGKIKSIVVDSIELCGASNVHLVGYPNSVGATEVMTLCLRDLFGLMESGKVDMVSVTGITTQTYKLT